MNCKLPRLVVAAIALGVLVPMASVAQEPARRSSYGRSSNKEAVASKQSGAGEGSAQLPPPTETDGNKLVAEAARHVFRQKAIEAKVRQRVMVFGQEVVGGGEYAQLSVGQQNLLRLEMKMQVGPQPATLLQVSGSRDLWIRRQVPPAPPRLEHVNLTRLRNALSRLDEEGKSIPSENWILLGGLSKLVESLHRNFNFALPKDSRIGDQPVLVLRGELKPERLKELQRESGGKKREEEPSTEQLPTAVILTLARADQPLPHFPYRIEYLRQLSEKELKAESAQDKDRPTEVSLSIIEFYEVRSPSGLDPQMFEFDPGDEESEDRTQSYVRKLEQ